MKQYSGWKLMAARWIIAWIELSGALATILTFGCYKPWWSIKLLFWWHLRNTEGVGSE